MRKPLILPILWALTLCLLISQRAQAEECSLLTSRERSTLHRCGELKLLYLKGNPLERAKEMGLLLKEQLSPRPVHYFSQKILDAVREKNPLVRWLFSQAYNLSVRRMHFGNPEFIALELDALAEGMGVDPILIKRAISLADSAANLNALGSLPGLQSLPAAGCTSVALKDENGQFVVGRNLDFAGANLWDRHPMVLVHLPEEGSIELRHIVFGADGTFWGGVTGVNEAGLSFAVHQNYAKELSLSGTPMMFIGELVLRQARGLEEAIEILEKYRPGPLWTFVLTDLKKGKVVAVESSQKQFELRHMVKNTFVQTNHLMHSDTQKSEFISIGTKMNSIYRMEKAFSLLEKNSASLLENIADILSHQESPSGEMAAYKDILKGHTIQTVILSSKSQTPDSVYVTLERAPSAGGKYAHFSLPDLFSGRGQESFQIVDLARVPERKRQRQLEISKAFHQYFDLHDVEGAMKTLESHKTLDAELFRSISLYQLNRFEESVVVVERALQNQQFQNEPAYILQSLQWVKLAALLKLEKNAEAKNFAADILSAGPVNLKLKDLCARVVEERRIPAWMLRFTFEFFSGDISGRAS